MGDKEALMDALKQYTACDVRKLHALLRFSTPEALTPHQISDALLKLKVPYAGFLVDIRNHPHFYRPPPHPSTLPH